MSRSWLPTGVQEHPTKPEDLEASARRLALQVRRRDRVEAIAGGVVIVVFTGYAALLPGFWVRTGAAMIVVAAVWVIWYLGTRGAPAGSSATDILVSYRQQLESQRDLLRSAWLWYVLPFVPGVMMLTAGLGKPERLWPAVALLSGGVAIVNRVGAAKLERQIEELPTSLNAR